MKKRHYYIIAVTAYFILLIATIPAKSVSRLINENTPLSIQGVSGTLWNGKAYIINIEHQAQLNNTTWSFTLWKLLIGKAAADINTEYANNKIMAEIGTSLLGRLFVNDLSANITAQEIAQLANIPLAQLSGLISFNIEHAHWKQGELPLASGEITWKDATITVADTASLGDVLITLGESEQQLLTADIKNKGGDIKITGNAALVAEANYTVNLKLLPTATASDNIIQSLGLFAKKQANGEFQLNNSGTLKQIGLM